VSVPSGQEVGAAYVTLLPSAKGFGKAVEGEIDAGTQGAEKKASKGFAGMAKTVGKWAAGAVVAVGGIITGLALKGGISRALNIEDAQAKLKGLGHDAASVEQIMTDALASVRGTAVGLDSAATIAASAVAAGIKPGQELEKYLKLTADAATIAGVSLDEMGSILNKTTSSGKVFTDNLNQLSDRGIPIFQWLADEYGVTQDELSKMVSAGKVDAETFRKVIEENIGGAALASGDTTRGAFANMMAALSRLGVTLTSAVMPHMKGLFGEITTIIDGLNERIGPFAERFAAWFSEKIGPAIEGMGTRFLDFVDKLSSGGELGGIFVLLSPLGVLLKAMLPLLETLGDALSDVGSAISDALMPVVPVLAAVLFVLVKKGIEPLIPLLGDALVAVLGLVAPLLTQLVPIFSDLLTGLLPMLPVVVALAEQAFPLLAEIVTTLLEALSPLLPVLGDLVRDLFPVLVSIVTTVLDALMPLLPVVTGLAKDVFPLLAQVVTSLLGALSPLLPVLGDLVRTLFPVLAKIIGVVLGAILPLVPAVLGLVEALVPIIGLVADLVATLLPPLLDLFVAILGPVLALIAPLIEALAPVLELIGTLLSELTIPMLMGLTQILVGVLAAVLPVATAIQGWLVGALTTLIGWLARVVTATASFVRDGVNKIRDFAQTTGTWLNTVVTFFTDLPGKIRDALSGAKDWLLDTGKKIIDGLIDGIRSGFEKVKETLGNLTSWLPDWKGPAEVDAKLLTDNGRLIMGSLIDGLESRFDDVRRSLGNLTSDLGDGTWTANVQPGAAGDPLAAGLHLSVGNVIDPEELAELILEYVRDALAVNDLQGVIV